jgi:predicted nucleic acid-binding protein
MRVVVDTNIVFSIILNTSSKLSRIILQPGSLFNFYSTEQLLREIEEHKLGTNVVIDYMANQLAHNGKQKINNIIDDEVINFKMYIYLQMNILPSF